MNSLFDFIIDMMLRELVYKCIRFCMPFSFPDLHFTKHGCVSEQLICSTV